MSETILKNSKEAGMPEISIFPYEGQILMLLLRIANANRGVEIGSLGGHSAGWLLNALAGKLKAHLWVLEKDARRLRFTSENLKEAGFSDSSYSLMEGAALDSLEVVSSRLNGSEIDFVFIDADKANSFNYAEWAHRHLRVGGMILIDNAYLFGRMFGEGKENKKISKSQYEAMDNAWKFIGNRDYFDSSIFSTPQGLAVAIKK